MIFQLTKCFSLPSKRGYVLIWAFMSPAHKYLIYLAYTICSDVIRGSSTQSSRTFFKKIYDLFIDGVDVTIMSDPKGEFIDSFTFLFAVFWDLIAILIEVQSLCYIVVFAPSQIFPPKSHWSCIVLVGQLFYRLRYFVRLFLWETYACRI